MKRYDDLSHFFVVEDALLISWKSPRAPSFLGALGYYFSGKSGLRLDLLSNLGNSLSQGCQLCLESVKNLATRIMHAQRWVNSDPRI